MPKIRFICQTAIMIMSAVIMIFLPIPLPAGWKFRKMGRKRFCSAAADPDDYGSPLSY
ncbi:MAG: hypothetical protein K2P64_03345 [Lachnospiraceae bacterium]|nr:hypothetical protein [Lachnospiraceae bacterium]